MMQKLLKLHKGQKGITGLETAIILIAFVVVAAVFAYTVLSAGLFATQKSQESVYSGLKEAQSSLELRGGVIATADSVGASGNISQLSFVVSNALGGEPMDFTPPTAASDNGGTAADDGSIIHHSGYGRVNMAGTKGNNRYSLGGLHALLGGRRPTTGLG